MQSSDREEKAKNIVIFNLADEEENNSNLLYTIVKMFKRAGLIVPDNAITDVLRLGKNKGKRTVMVKFIGVRWVKLIFTKITVFRKHDIVIVNDRSPQEREKNRADELCQTLKG